MSVSTTHTQVRSNQGTLYEHICLLFFCELGILVLAGFVCHFKCSVVKGPDDAEGPTGATGLVFDRQLTADAAQNGTP